MKIENRKRFIIKRLDGKDDHVTVDEDEIFYIGSRIAVKDKTKRIEYYLETDLEDIVVISKKDYKQLKSLHCNVNNCEEAKDDK